MKVLSVVLATASTLVTAFVATSQVFAADVSPARTARLAVVHQAPAAPAGQVAQWGHVKSLVRKGRRYELRFDPAWWLGGVTASRAALEDTGSSDVPNDYYVVDESHRALTYLVPTTARVTVLVNSGTRGIRPTRIGVAELAQIVKGRNPRGRALYDRGNHLGYWIRVAADTVRSLDQQYQP
jgi:hypothetical protein